MITNQEITDAAMSPASNEELRLIIDRELMDISYETSDLKLVIAADLICDAAFEVVAQLSDDASIKKIVSLGPKTMALQNMSIFTGLRRMFEDNKVTMDALPTLVLRSPIFDTISKAVEAGACREELVRAEIALAPLRLTQLLEKQLKSKGLLRRLFG